MNIPCVLLGKIGSAKGLRPIGIQNVQFMTCYIKFLSLTAKLIMVQHTTEQRDIIVWHYTQIQNTTAVKHASWARFWHNIGMNSRAMQLKFWCPRISHIRISLSLWQPVNCIFWPMRRLNWLVAASKLHKSA